MTEQKAPKNKIRVIGVDTFEGPTEDYLIGDFDSFKEAKNVANQHGAEMHPVYCYDSDGNMVYTAGSY